MSGDLIDTTEMYLRTVYELLEEGVVPLRARIAERLHQSGPTVSQTVARMERDGLLVVDTDRTIKLTRTGAHLARDVMRKHRLAERLLVGARETLASGTVTMVIGLSTWWAIGIGALCFAATALAALAWTWRLLRGPA